ncbi:hypothetical protein BGZ57DRAFT_931249 [Hyaloscypha finlandica]|nr:hypothetical protein BGZ57DRAFT_931249 [Hyaloscypha finlandica]
MVSAGYLLPTPLKLDLSTTQLAQFFIKRAPRWLLVVLLLRLYSAALGREEIDRGEIGEGRPTVWDQELPTRSPGDIWRPTDFELDEASRQARSTVVSLLVSARTSFQDDQWHELFLPPPQCIQQGKSWLYHTLVAMI